MANKGWVSIHRQLQDCWIWQDKPYAKGQAWVDLLLLANHSDKTILFNGNPKVVERGQYLTSLRKLSERWGWSIGKAKRFLSSLEDENMIKVECKGNGTVVTIVKYDVFQDTRNSDGTVTEHQWNTNGTPTEQWQNSDGTVTETNNNVNNVNNENNENNENKLYTDSVESDAPQKPKRQKDPKHQYGEYKHVLLTDKQRDKLFDEYGEMTTLDAIKYLDEYIQMKGYKAKDHNLALRKWVFRAVEEQRQKSGRQNSFGNSGGGIDWSKV